MVSRSHCARPTSSWPTGTTLSVSCRLAGALSSGLSLRWRKSWQDAPFYQEQSKCSTRTKCRLCQQANMTANLRTVCTSSLRQTRSQTSRALMCRALSFKMTGACLWKVRTGRTLSPQMRTGSMYRTTTTIHAVHCITMCTITMYRQGMYRLCGLMIHGSQEVVK